MWESTWVLVSCVYTVAGNIEKWFKRVTHMNFENETIIDENNNQRMLEITAEAVNRHALDISSSWYIF